MKLDLCLIASDLNETYYGLFPFVKDAWNNIIGIPVKLILIADFIPTSLQNYSDDIILFKPIQNIHTAFIAQNIRLLFPSLIKDKNIIISDMDIIPLKKTYFIDSIINIHDNFIIYRDAYIKQNMYAMCYCAGHTNDWYKLFNINNEHDIINTLKEWYNNSFNGQKNCDGWFTDQLKLFKHINNTNINFTVLKDCDIGYKRLDKRDKDYIVKNTAEIYTNIKNGLYSDFHVIRPYYKYISLIKQIIKFAKN
jgi:hypothetical protein